MHRPTVLLQIGFYIVDHLIDTLSVIAEYRSPVTLEHHIDQAPESVLLVRYQLQEHSCDEILPLYIPGLGVIGAKSLQHVIESVLTCIGLNFELFYLREGPC